MQDAKASASQERSYFSTILDNLEADIASLQSVPHTLESQAVCVACMPWIDGVVRPQLLECVALFRDRLLPAVARMRVTEMLDTLRVRACVVLCVVLCCVVLCCVVLCVLCCVVCVVCVFLSVSLCLYVCVFLSLSLSVCVCVSMCCCRVIYGLPHRLIYRFLSPCSLSG